MDWRLVVGLGNPGRRYERTPHNAGFMAVDRMAESGGCVWRRSWRFPAHLADWPRERVSLALVKPATFMNASGDAVAPLLRKRGWDPKNVIVVLDDADLPIGSIRVRPRGSSGGHRGLQSVIERLGTDEFARVRIGVGRKAETGLIEQVLRPFGPGEWAAVREAIGTAADAVIALADEGVEKTMNRFNRTTKDGRTD
ncbi:MAG: aminoacyl-tRNA hydrolase [Kiritimatiellia bacterium]|nr:aminoacyl-tRNA hydrolase [Kiritimatiellia bacterium]